MRYRGTHRARRDPSLIGLTWAERVARSESRRLWAIVAALVAVMVALIVVAQRPAGAHAPDEISEWTHEWVIRVAEAHGITPALLAELRDFQEAHKCEVLGECRSVAAPRGHDTTYRGMGTDVERWRSLVSKHFGNETDLALCVMRYESGGNPNARHPSSGAAGLFQIMPFWWSHFGGDRYDPETNVRTARTIRGQQGWAAWSAYNRGKC